MKGQRPNRVGSEYRKEISGIISGPLKDKEPDLKGIISVTEVDVAPDLKTAKVYVSVYAPNQEEEGRTFSIIQENAGFIRHELSLVMRMRTVPQLTFLRDSSMEYGSKMDSLLSGLNRDEK